MDKQKKRSAVDSIIVTCTKNPKVSLWHAGQDGYATIHHEHYPVGSAAFQRWVANALYGAGIKVTPTQFKTALPIIEAACFDGDDHKVYYRIARPSDGIIYIDLGERFVQITEAGWAVADDVPVKFVRGNNFGVMPMPRPGSVDELREVVSTDDDNWTLIKGWMLDCLKGNGPFHILIVNGPEGSAKTSLCRTLKLTLDPVACCPLLSVPRKEEDFGSYCSHDFILAFDNVSRLASWQSDILCRIATGAGFRKRKLYTDDEQLLVHASRPQILNGIPEFAEAPDLLSRAILVTQPRVERYRTEVDLAENFRDILPGVLGGLFDMVAAGLRADDLGETDERMADSGAWIGACGLSDWSQAYKEAREFGEQIVMDASPIANLVVRLVKFGPVECTAAELLDKMRRLAYDLKMELDQRFPTTPKALSDNLLRDASLLHRMGVKLVRRKTNGLRLIGLSETGSQDKETGSQAGSQGSQTGSQGSQAGSQKMAS